MIAKLIKLSGLFVFYWLPVIAQQESFNHRFRHWNAGQGLRATSVLCMQKGSDGYLWVGTSNGIQPFNGSKFHNGASVKQPDAVSGRLSAIHKAKDGRLWVGVDQVGIASFSPTRLDSSWQWYSFGKEKGGNWPAMANIRDIKSDYLGNIWLVTENEGVFTLNPKSGKTQKIIVDAKKARFFESSRCMYFMDSTTLLVGLVNNLFLVDIISGKVTYPTVTFQESKNQPSYWHFEPLNKDTLLVGTDRGFFLLDSKTWTLNRYKPPVHSAFKGDIAVNRVLYFGEDQCWIGTEGEGLLFLNLKTGAWAAAKDAARSTTISSARINDMMRDEQGFIWVAHDQGLSCYDPCFNLITSHPVPELQGFRQHVIASVTPWGDIWYPGGQGIGRFSLKENRVDYQPVSFPPGMRNRQHLFRHARYGLVLISRSGIWQVDTVQWKFTPMISFNTIDPELPMVGKGMDTIIGRLNQVFMDTLDSNEFWMFATAEMHRLAYYFPGRQTMGYFRNLKLHANVVSYGTEINRFTRDANGGLWIASQPRGIFYMPNLLVDSAINYWKGNPGKQHFPFNAVKDIYFDTASRELWATVSGAGLLRIDWRRTDSLRFEVFDDKQGLQHNDLLRIVPVGNRYFFISSTNGIHAFDRELQRFYLFNWRFGLEYSRLLSGFGDYVAGRCVFAVPGNFISFDPVQLLQVNRYRPQLVLYLWREGNRESVGLNKSTLQLSFESRDLIIEPDIIDFQQSGNYMLKYRLIGYNPDWITVPAGTQIPYSKLPGGDYRFECKLMDGAEQLGDVYSFSLAVATPFYKSYWFFAALVALLIASVWVWQRSQQQKRMLQLKYQNELLKLENERQSALAQERERITADLHDDAGATLSSLYIYGDLANRMLENNPGKTRDMLNRIMDTSRDLMQRMNDIIWSLKPHEDQKNPLQYRLLNYCQEIFGSEEVNITCEADEEINSLLTHPASRKNLLLIAREALNNASKYSGTNRVAIYLKKTNGEVELRIRDNGKGFDPGQIKKGNGLDNMQKRAQQSGGSIQIKSKPGEGTEITCRMPAH